MESKAFFFRDSFGHLGQIHLFRIGDRSTRTTRVFGCKGHNECDVGHAKLEFWFLLVDTLQGTNTSHRFPKEN